MARKDVDLVIRARDQAKGAITSITKALEQFVESQDDIQTSATKTDSALGRLGTSLGDLQKAFGGLTASAKVSSELEKARTATERLSRSTAEATGEAIGYAREARQAARATGVLRQESERVATAITNQKRAVDGAQTAQARLTKITRDAGNERARLAEGERKLADQIEKQRLKLALASAAYRDLQQEITSTTGPTLRLEQRMSGVSRVIRETEGKLDELRTTQSVVRSSMDATSRSVERANSLYGKQAATLTTQTQALDRLEGKQREIGSAVKAAATNQQELQRAANRAAGSLTEQVQSLERAEAGYRELQAVTEGVEGSLSELEQRVRGPLLKAFGEQASRVAGLRQEYERASSTATALGRDMSRLDEPAEDVVRAFEENRAAASRARQEFREQQEELGRLRRVLKESGGDLDAFASRQQRVQTVLNRAEASYREYATETARAAAANRRAASAAIRAAEAEARRAAGHRQAGVAARRAARETNTLAGAIRTFYGESRTALSFTQRLRGEVLALVAAYGGFFAIIEGVRGVVDAYQTLEGAQSRLNAVFDGDQQAVANELDFIRRTAERLGVEFGVLANEYTKFAVATDGTNLAGAETRRIFTAVAEAARVNRATNDQLRGTFVALTQIVNKGSVSMEELRQQLGDRLPGAIQIMADAVGVGTDELIKMIEQGQVSSDYLAEFADELDERFGDALPEALETTTTALGRLQNALFQSALRVANGGFIAEFNDLLNDLTNTLQSAQFESFLDRISVALATAADAVAFLARNFDLIVIAITAFIGLKIAPFIILLVSRLGLLTGSSVSVVRGFRAMSVAINTGTVSMTRAQVAARSLTIAMRTLLSSTGIGLAVVAIGAAIGAWVTRTNDATEALNTHRGLVTQVRDAYDSVGGSIDQLRARLERLTVTQARTNLQSLELQLRSLRKAFADAIPRNVLGNPVNAGGGYIREVAALFERFEEGAISAQDFAKELDSLAEQYRDLYPINAQLAETFDELARDILGMSNQAGEARDILLVLTGTEEEAAAALDRLSGAAEETADGIRDLEAEAREFNGALNELRGLVPSLADEMEELNERAKLEDALNAALQLATTYGQVAQAVRLYEQALNDIENREALQLFDGAAGGGIGAAAALIRTREGFRSQAYNDPRTDSDGNQVGPDIFRAGFGSDTVTLSDGTIVRITEGMRVTREDADRDLLRRIGEFQGRVQGQVGEARFASFAPQQQAVLTSIAYNYGELPDRIVDAVRTGSASEISAAILTLQDDNGGVNANRRAEEARIFGAAGDLGLAGGAGDEFLIREAEERARLAQEEEEARLRANEQTAEAIANGQFQIEQQELINAGREREAAIQEAIREAREQNANITDAEIAQITEQAGRLFDLQAAEENRLTATERVEEAEQRVNDVLALRQQLQEELATQIQQGASPEVVAELREQLQTVNEQLREAIENALELATAMGSSDPAVQAMISRMRQLEAQGAETARRVVLEFDAVRNALANSLVNAANRFSKSLAEGKSVAESLGDAFRQFAADFLRQIAQMILQQLAFNAAKRALNFFGFGVSHLGGVVGAQGAKRRIAVGAASAMRYHTGGVAGLAPNEVPTILERGEEVLTRDDPRHIFNGATGKDSAGQSVGVKIINALSSDEIVSEGLSTRSGEQAILNFIRANRDAVRAELDG